MDQSRTNGTKNVNKQETPSNFRRLASLRAPRDYTLQGGNPPAKKQFVPNLNIRRKKNNPKEDFLNHSFKAKEQKGSKFAVKKRDANKVIQSEGVFSTGIGTDLKRSLRWRNDKENDSSPPILTIPTLKKISSEINEKLESNVHKELTDCDEDYDEKMLPFQPSNWRNTFSEGDVEPRIKLEIKTEPCDEFTKSDIKSVKSEIKSETNQTATTEYIDHDTYNDYNPALSLWKLPDSFSGKAFGADPSSKELVDYCLNNMSDGQIGKLVFRQSGKMEVHIGINIYQFDKSDLPTYTEDIVCLDERKNRDNKGKAVILGEIKNRYVLAPEWSQLLS